MKSGRLRDEVGGEGWGGTFKKFSFGTLGTYKNIKKENLKGNFIP